ncbi:MAG: hypothetical protein HN509_07525 [Halobacteriovoraceae bacterium]|nr:hypothetical protein [Halobacteriovoraceae bacterium]
MNKKLSKNFFLISFLPAIAYWYLEENYALRIAIMGGLILAVLELSLEWFFSKHIHTLSKFNFFLILGLGGVSLLGEEGIWFKLQPAFTGVGIGSFLLYKVLRGKGLMQEMMESLNPDRLLPEPIVAGMEKHFSLLFLGYGIFMGFVAVKFTTSEWVFYKTIGFYITFAILMLFEFFWIRIQMKKWMERQAYLQMVMKMGPKK